MKTRPVRIYSENDEFQRILVIRDNRSKRNKRKEFFVEGVRSINQAVHNHWNITALVYSREKRLSDWAEQIINDTEAVHFELPLDLMKKVSQKEETSELVALVGMPADDLKRIPIREKSLVLILDRPVYPNNIGTIIRSCDALRVDGVIITGHSADLYDPETIKASTGSFFSVPSVRLASQNELLPWISEVKTQIPALQIVGTSEDGKELIQEHDFTRPTLLLAGNETRGLSEAYRSLCDAMVAIPMSGSASSLNVACATSIVLYEIDRQRRAETSPLQ